MNLSNLKYLLLSLLVIVVGVSVFMVMMTRQKKIKIVTEMQGREILFPSTSIFSSFLKDTTYFDLEDNMYKVLVYADSIGCLSCKLRLEEWKVLMTEFDSLSFHIQYLFFIHPINKRDLLQTLLMSNFDYPVCYDSEDSLNVLNQFPSNPNYQTMLLDCNNEVVLLGNPVNNINIRKLYIDYLKNAQ